MSFASQTHPVIWHDVTPIAKAIDAINPLHHARPVAALVNQGQRKVGVLFVARGQPMLPHDGITYPRILKD